MKILIAGLGSIGRRHLRNLLTLGERDIILYRTHQSTLPDDELDPFVTETNLDAALAHQPDAVIVANPTALHLEVAIPAAKAGCHMLIEKPIAAVLDEEVEELQRVVHQSGVRVLVGFQFRFHPTLAQIQSILVSGKLGRPYSFRAHWGEYLPEFHPWEDYRQSYAARKELGGGVVNTLSHPFDYMRWLLGEIREVSALTAQVSTLELSVEDVAEIMIRFDNGALGSVHLDYFQRPKSHILEIICERGQIRWMDESGKAEIYYAELDHWDRFEPSAGFDRNQMFLEEMQHFIDLVKGETESRCSLNDGIKAMALTTAVHQSARNKAVVKL